MNNKIVKAICLIVLGLFVFNLAAVSISYADRTPVEDQSTKTYFQILNYSIQATRTLLIEWGIPHEHYAWKLLENASNIEKELLISQITDDTLLRKHFQEAMNYIHSAISLASYQYLDKPHYETVKEFMMLNQDINVLNEIIKSLKFKLLNLNQSTSLNNSKAEQYLSQIEEISAQLKSLQQYLGIALSSPNDFNKTYFLHEVNRIKELVKALNDELNKIHIMRTKERINNRINVRLKELNDNIDKIKKDLSILNKLGIPLVEYVVGQQINNLTNAINEVNTAINELRNLSDVEHIRRVSRINEITEVLYLRIRDINTTIKHIPKFVDAMYSRVAEINEISERLARRLENNGGIPPSIGERLNQMLKIRNQLTYLSNELMKKLLTNTGGINEVLNRFEGTIREGRGLGRDIRESLHPSNQFSKELLPLIEDLERSLNDTLESVGGLDEVFKIVRNERTSYVRSLINMNVRILEDLKLCAIDAGTKELIDNAIFSLMESLRSFDSGDLSNAKNYLNNALNTAVMLKGRFPYIHELRVNDLIRYIDLASGTFQTSN
ncbi:MAG: hypothetical protein QXO98_04140 [Sulfolobales archaeon]